MGELFRKKALHERTNFGQIYGGIFNMGNDIRSCKGGVNGYLRGFKGRVKLVLLSLILTLVIDILIEPLTPKIGD